MAQGESGKQDDVELAARRNRTEPIGRAGSVAAQAFARAGFRDPSLVLRWREIVGAEVARFAQPLKLSEGPAGGTLTLQADSAASVFLQHQSRALCERINRFLGREAVTRIRFVSGAIVAAPEPVRRPPPPAEPRPDDPVRAFAGPDRLKEALTKFARARQRPTRD